MDEPHHAIERLTNAIRNVPDFPKKGIIFKDITPILKDPELFRLSIELFCDACKEVGAEKIVGIDARGFLFGSATAYRCGLGFVPLRKKGKLPYKTKTATYSLEYGEAELQIHTDAIKPGERVVIIDDLLATGGTASAAAELVGELQAEVVEVQFLMELKFLDGREKLGDLPIRSFIVDE